MHAGVLWLSLILIEGVAAVLIKKDQNAGRQYGLWVIKATALQSALYGLYNQYLCKGPSEVMTKLMDGLPVILGVAAYWLDIYRLFFVFDVEIVKLLTCNKQ